MMSANSPAPVFDTAVVEYGDYQTPVAFARAVCEKLRTFHGLTPDVVLEPTFGVGNFFGGIASAFPDARALYGIEINKAHCEVAQRKAGSTATLFNADVFSFDFGKIRKELSSDDSLLILGNPPWVTNSQLTSIGSGNIPVKSNFKKHSGLDAMTGKGNFDIAEYIILRLLNAFADHDCTLAMLCKTIVAKNLVRDIDKHAFSLSAMEFFAFDANEVFGVSCDAGLLVVRTGKPARKTCAVYDFGTNRKIREFGWVGNAFYADTLHAGRHAEIDGVCHLEWRQGIKHDCSKVMELKAGAPGIFENSMGGTLACSPGRVVFPLAKSSDIKQRRITRTRRYVIVPQRRVNGDTSLLRERDPAVWEYLQKHDALLSARKSVIYKKAPKYAIFGIGEYSFAKYKVAVSGFYKEPVFALVAGDMPIMLDDTCYFLGFDALGEAVITFALLNSPECAAFLKSIAFLDSKRPYTKDVLQRIDLRKLCGVVGFDAIRKLAAAAPAEYVVTRTEYETYRAAPPGALRLVSP